MGHEGEARVQVQGLQDAGVPYGRGNVISAHFLRRLRKSLHRVTVVALQHQDGCMLERIGCFRG